MDSESTAAVGLPLSNQSVICCKCSSSCIVWSRSLKRKFDLIESNGRDTLGNSYAVAHVEVENECAALREALASSQQTILELSTELEEERNASASAASEAMSMILRLQREKAEAQMDARQFKRFADEKMAHDQQELVAMEDLLYKRDQLIHSLNCEIQAYKHRLMSFGYDEAEAEEVGLTDFPDQANVDHNAGDQSSEPQYECLPTFDYPPLRCNLNETPKSPGTDLFDKYAFGETPRERLQNLEHRINQLEQTPRHDRMKGTVFSATKNFVDRATGVPTSPSPRWARHTRKLSTDSSGSFFGTVKEAETPKPIRIRSIKNPDYSPVYRDDVSDRVYTVDSVQGMDCSGHTGMKVGVGNWDDYGSTPRELWGRVDPGETDVQKLYARLQALEADRESMRQAIISMRTDKAQMVLLKQIAQHLYQDMSPEKKVCVKKPSLIGSFSVVSVLKWVLSFVFWKRKAKRSKYMFGHPNNNLGLLLLLDKNPYTRQWRCLTRASPS